jgi:hypothetical protein
VRERKGALGRATGIAEGVAAVVRRRQHDREPRIAVYDSRGLARVMQPASRGYDHVLDSATALVELVDEAGALSARGRRTGRRRPDEEDAPPEAGA